MTSSDRFIVDMHTHLWTPAEMQEFGKASEFTVDNLLDHRERNGITVSCVSNTLHHAQISGKDVDGAIEDARRWHDFAVEVHAEHPEIYFWASAIPSGGVPYVEELQRVMSEPAFVGVMVNSSYNEASPDDDAAEPFWEYAGDQALSVYMHPPFNICGDDRLREYRFISTLGRPNDVVRGLARSIVSGVLERHPDVRLIASHLGGSISEYVNRLDYAYNLRGKLKGLGDYGDTRITREPSSYLKHVWLETSAYPSPAITCAAETVGADRIVFGSDTPPMMALGAMSVKVVEQARLTEEEKRGVFGENALRALARPQLRPEPARS